MVGNQDINVPTLADDVGDHCRDLRWISDVRRGRKSANLEGNGAQSGRRDAIVDHHGGPGLRQAAGMGSPHALRRPRNEDDFSAKVWIEPFF
jgi:hypothetical protein